jgi:transposase
VGIVEETVPTDTLGRRTGPRTRHMIEEKLRVVEETRVAGASVAMVARRHNLNANQVFGWRRLYRRGLLIDGSAREAQRVMGRRSNASVSYSRARGVRYVATPRGVLGSRASRGTPQSAPTPDAARASCKRDGSSFSF